jgi:hypothetical protein
MMLGIDRLAAGLEQTTRESIACLSRPTFVGPGSEKLALETARPPSTA